MRCFKHNKKGDSSILLGIILSLVIISIPIVVVANAFNNNPFKNNFDNVEKLKSFNFYLDKLESGTLKSAEYTIVASTNDLFLFFSAGSDPIVLKYKYQIVPVSKSHPISNGDYIFERPAVSECKDSACICYSSHAKFWRQIETKPYLAPLDLYVSYPNNEQVWSDGLIRCIKVPNDKTIFSNSRGWDADFVDAKSELLPLEVPVSLQSSIDDSMKNLFTKFFRRTEFLKNSYTWEGGVVIGGMGVSQDKTDRDNHILIVPPYNLTFEKISGTNIIGVCLQSKCLYSKGIEKAKEQDAKVTDLSMLLLSFDGLKSYLLNDFSICLANNPNIDVCANSLQLELTHILSVTNQNQYIKFDNTLGTTKVTLNQGNKELASMFTSFEVPKINGVSQSSVVISSQSNNYLVVGSAQYNLSLIFDGGSYLLNLVS